MIYYKQYKPSAQVSDFIECYWVWRISSCYTQGTDRLIPGGRLELIFNFGDPLTWLISPENPEGTTGAQTQFLGQRSKVFYARQAGPTDILGIRFKPGGLSAFCGVGAIEFLDQMVPADAVFGNKINEWESQLSEEKNEWVRIGILDHMFSKLFKAGSKDWAILDRAVVTIRQSENSNSMHEVCALANIHYKKLERLFVRNIGYTPKYYSRIVRFNKALRRVQFSDNSLTSIGYDCDFFDQSHFIKDFRHFAGTTPKSFAKEENTIANFLIRNQPV